MGSGFNTRPSRQERKGSCIAGEGFFNRTPSPPPVYDSNGQRTNTREGRRREKLDLERREAIGDCMRLNPLFKPPSGYKPVYKEAKLYIPVKDYPGYNFIGVILGPRGNTQKRMEAETGSRIAIRGKGAVKEGKRSNAVRLQGGRRDAKEAEGAFEDLHVHITADSVEKVDAAVALVEPLLTPVDEDRNAHKRKQLRELAEMNGTMRDLSKTCGVCGETGHRDWHCPKSKLTTFQAKVDCQICGDGGHPTIDCPRKNQTGQGKVLDNEYLNFLEELGYELAGPTAATNAHVTKLGGEDLPCPHSQPGSKTTANLSDDAATMPAMSTSFDPNQLFDVINRPQQTVIPLSNIEWPPDNVYTHNSEETAGQAQPAAGNQFPRMFQAHPTQVQCNTNSGNFRQPGFFSPPDPSLYQGHVSSWMNLNTVGLHVPPGSAPACGGPFYGNGETGSEPSDYPMLGNGGDLRRPCQIQVFTAPAGISGVQTYPCAKPQAVGVNSSPVVWECNQLQGNWKTGSLCSAWQMNCEGPHLMPPTPFSQSAPWEASQKPWETISHWNASNFPTNQQEPLHFHPHHAALPSMLVSGHFIWKDGPAPQSFRESIPFKSGSIPPPRRLNFVPHQSHPNHLESFKRRQSHAHPVPEFKTFLNNPAPSQFTQSKVTSMPQPPPSRLLHRANDLYAADHYPPSKKSTNIESDGGQLKVPFASPVVMNHDASPNSSILQTQPLESAHRDESGGLQLVLDPPLDVPTSPDRNTKPAVETPVIESPVEVDSEYERLMASVGVT
ncbi:hypothetical protein R1flu_020269 [Riccia fluitans]|uniref:Branchpoint-bridging protein n=1 Tax=Riccia fluitans TaxID=41844 RepID=A0ABD1ZL08_9MARC